MSAAPYIRSADRTLLDRRAIIDTMRDALTHASLVQVQSPMPGQLVFEAAGGDCHIKCGHMTDGPNFSVKSATGYFGFRTRAELS